MESSSDYLNRHFGTKDIVACGELNRRRVIRSWYRTGINGLTRLKLPYYAPGPHNPPIPSVSDIIAAQGTPLNRPKYVNRILEKYVLKSSYSFGVFQEAENHIFLERHSDVRIPKLYAAFSHDEEKSGQTWTKYYLLMEYIEGFHLDDDLYKSLDISLQEKAGKALGTQFQALRAVPSEGYYGRVNNQGWPAAEILAEGPSEENPDILGPYSSYEQFINMLYNSALFKAATLRVQSDYGKEQLLILRNFIYSLSCVPESERVPVLFHRDIHWQNIIFTEVRSPSGEVCDYKATLIDLERLSWLPKWMQLGMLDLFTKFAFRNFYLEAAKALEPLNVPMGKWLCDHLMREVFVVL